MPMNAKFHERNDTTKIASMMHRQREIRIILSRTILVSSRPRCTSVSVVFASATIQLKLLCALSLSPPLCLSLCFFAKQPFARFFPSFFVFTFYFFHFALHSGPVRSISSTRKQYSELSRHPLCSRRRFDPISGACAMRTYRTRN